MMSAKFFSAKKQTPFLADLKKRDWVIALTILCFFLYYVVGLILGVQFEKSSYSTNQMVKVIEYGKLFAKEYLSSSILTAVMATALGVIYGIQSFAFLYRRDSVDFYLSQPMTRLTRFRKEAVASIASYGVLLFVFSFVGYLLCFPLKVGVGSVVGDIFKTNVLLMCLFMASYFLGTLSALLSGTTLLALGMVAYFSVVELVVRLAAFTLQSMYISTYYGDYDFYNLISDIFTIPLLNAYSEDFGISILKNLILAAVFLLLSAFAFDKRKVEKAGVPIAFPLVENILKISVSILGGIFFAILVDVIFSSTNEGFSLAPALVLVLVVALVCLIAEIIFGKGLQGAKRRLWQIPVCSLVALLFFFGFKADFLGIESYVPSAEKVESYGVCWKEDAYSTNLLASLAGELNTAEYIEENMELLNVEDMVALHQACVDKTDELETSGELATMYVYYHMVNGDTKRYTVAIPQSVSEELLSAVFAEKDYTDFMFPMDEVKKAISADENNGYVIEAVCYPALYEAVSLNGSENFDYASFLDAYAKDITNHFNYTNLRNSEYVGSVSIDTVMRNSDETVLMYNFCLYSGFENTLSYLEQCGLTYQLSKDAFLEGFGGTVTAEIRSKTGGVYTQAYVNTSSYVSGTYSSYSVELSEEDAADVLNLAVSYDQGDGIFKWARGGLYDPVEYAFLQSEVDESIYVSDESLDEDDDFMVDDELFAEEDYAYQTSELLVIPAGQTPASVLKELDLD